MARMNLVCADREKLSTGILSARFNHLGWHTRFALSCGEAIGLIEDDLPDVLITEIQLQASNGYGLINAVRRHADAAVAAVPIVILSHMAQPEDIKLGIRLGADRYVTKPFDLVKLEKNIVAIAGRLTGPARS